MSGTEIERNSVKHLYFHVFVRLAYIFQDAVYFFVFSFLGGSCERKPSYTQTAILLTSDR